MRRTTVKFLVFIGTLFFVLGVVSFVMGPFRGPWSSTYNSTWAAVSFLLLIVGGLCSVIALREFMKKGFDFYSFAEEVHVDEERLKQRYKIESLYRQVGHTEEWLQGFSEAFDFFASNYLTEENVGVTELEWWKMTLESGEEPGDNLEAAYRAYMVISLMQEKGILDDEFIKIGYMVRNDSVKELLGGIPYINYMIENMKKDCAQSFSEFKKEDGDGEE